MIARASLILLLVLALAAPWVARHDPWAQDRGFTDAPPSRTHWLGTDDYGRDLWSRFVFGARWSILAGAASTLVALLLGWTLGGVAGFAGGWADTGIMMVSEWFMAVPWLYLLIAARAALPLDLPPRTAALTILLLIALVNWARPAKLVRGLTASLSQRGFVDAARGFGVSPARIFARHIFPGTMGLLVAQSLTLLPRFVLAEVTLSFLGLGVSEPYPSWGALILPLKQVYLLPDHWWKAFPTLCMLPFFAGAALAARQAEKRFGILS